MAQLIVRTDFTAYADIGSNVPVANITRAVSEAQEMDLRPILTPDFYTEVQAVADTSADSGNLTLADYNLLLPYIKPVLVYFAYARFLRSHNQTSTSFGLVQKETPYSSPISEATISALVKSERSKAAEYADRMTEYIEDNLDKFTTYQNSQKEPKQAGNSAGIWSV